MRGKNSKVLLLVLDGWGYRRKKSANAIALAQPKFFQQCMKKFPHTALNASGTAVGLPSQVIGNSEVGHLHLATGRVVTQDLERINQDIRKGGFFKNKTLENAFNNAKKSRLHILGLVSDGGVHSHINHLLALLELARTKQLGTVVVHAFLDGRDVAQKSAETYLNVVQKKLMSGWHIGSIIGRWYAMDRDNRWKREKQAYELLVNGIGKTAQNWKQGLAQAYACGETDEFVTPTQTSADSQIRDDDVVVLFNFRADRARELVNAFCKKDFSGFSRIHLSHLHFVCMTQDDPALQVSVVYPQCALQKTLGEIISAQGFTQVRIAETEKWAHVTYFFNGLSDKVFSGEKRILIPSPKVSTYDLAPEMKAKEIARVTVQALSENSPFILVNFANADMVGHTAKLKPCVNAIRAIDNALAQIIPEAINKGVDVIITGDHGNAEQLAYPNGIPMTSHTTAPVPFILISSRFKKLRPLKNSGLVNVAPTVLKLLGIPQPHMMNATSLV